MDVIFDVGAPVFGILFAGYLCGRTGLFKEATTEALNAFVFWLAFPALIFLSLAEVPISSAFDWPLLAVYVGAVSGTFALAIIVGGFAFGHRPAALVIHGLVAAFANTAYMGVPLALSVGGSDVTLPVILFTVFNASVLLGIGVLLIELDMRADHPLWMAIVGAARAVATNPLVLAGAAGLTVAAYDIDLPGTVTRIAGLLGDAAPPVALVAMGAFLVGKRPVTRVGEIGWLVFLKMLIHPVIAFWLAHVLLADVDPRVATTIMSAALPTGTLVFVIALRYRLLVDQVGTAILITTLLSAISVPAVLAHFLAP